jgi:hypothetical protein
LGSLFSSENITLAEKYNFIFFREPFSPTVGGMSVIVAVPIASGNSRKIGAQFTVCFIFFGFPPLGGGLRSYGPFTPLFVVSSKRTRIL